MQYAIEVEEQDHGLESRVKKDVGRQLQLTP
jgi:hypothetical protein